MATIIKGKNRNKPYTVRYYHDGKQREKSFRLAGDARDFRAKFEHDSRANIFIDPRVERESFGAVALRWLDRHPGTPKTKQNYEMALRLHILPVFGSLPLARVARDREAMEHFIRDKLPAKGLGSSVIRTCYMVVNAIVNDAVRAGRVGTTRLRGVELPDAPVRSDITFATRDQMEIMAALIADEHPGYEHTIYLMRGCGLRIAESLGIMSGDLVGGGTLRLARQLAPDASGHIPLKHRKEGDFRDVPCPDYVIPSVVTMKPVRQRTYRDWFNRARDAAGLPGSFTPHTLRHTFASIALAGGVPITDVSKWLGHRNIQTTFSIYGHLVPASWDRAREVLGAEWQTGS